MTTMLHWKECVSRWWSIYTSRAKSAIGTVDLVEYNSEWFAKGVIVKPTFRWVSACLETTVTEKFIDRIRIAYNTLTQVLEGGGKVLECAIIQICQAWMHYMLIGLHNNILSPEITVNLHWLKDPSLGYFPLDSDFNCGLTGVDFQLYVLYLKTEYGRGLKAGGYEDPDIGEVDMETRDVSVSQDLRSHRLKFGNLKIWTNMIRRMRLPNLEKIVEEVEQNPYLIFTKHSDWEHAKHSIYLKVFQPGVKESISKHSPMARMMAASAYIASRPCITRYDEKNIKSDKKVSLYKALIEKVRQARKLEKLNIVDVFPHHAEYKEVLDYIQELEESGLLTKVAMRSKTKQKIAVFERHVDDIAVSDLCKKVWLGLGRLPLSSRQIKTFWESYKVKYTFLRDSLEGTKEVMGLSTVELKNYLESLDSKPRYVMLLDTTAKSGSLFGSITRIFWANTKILLPGKTELEESSYSLRSQMFSILTSWYSDINKREKVSNLLKSSSILKSDKVPDRVRKLKVIRDWLCDGQKQKLMSYIREEKIGSVGFFTKRQSGFGKSRQGSGEWRGSCLGMSTIVRMTGNTCHKIIINRLYDLNNLGPALRELIQGFSLEPPSYLIDSKYWLTPTGKIVGGGGKAKYVPIDINPDLKVDIVDKVTDYNWRYDIAGTRIKLIADLSTDCKITILSEGFFANDWDPNMRIENDTLLTPWSSGSPIDINTLEEEFSSAIKRNPGDTLRCMKKLNLRLTKSGWNIQGLINTVSNHLLKEVLPPMPQVEDLTMVTDDELDEMMMMMNTDMNAIESLDILDWAEDDVIDKDIDGDLFDDVMFDEETVAQLDLFSQVLEVDDVFYQNRWEMPRSNMAFESLNQMSRVQFSSIATSFKTLVKSFRENSNKVAPEFLGHFLSFFCGRVCFPTRLSAEEERLIAIEEDISSLTTSLQSERDLADVNIKEIEDTILYLKENIEKTPELLRAPMLANLRKFERIRALRSTTPKKEYSLEKYSTFEIIIALRKKIMNLKMLPTSYDSLDDSIFCAVVRSELDEKGDEMAAMGEISKHEQSLYREANSRPYATTLLLDSLGFRFNLQIQASGYRTSGDYLVDLDKELDKLG